MSRHLPESSAMIRLLIPTIQTISLMHFQLNLVYLKPLLIIALLHLFFSLIAERYKFFHHELSSWLLQFLVA